MATDKYDYFNLAGIIAYVPLLPSHFLYYLYNQEANTNRCSRARKKVIL